MTRPFFSRERISDFDIYDKHCDTTLQLAKTRLAEGYPFDFQVVFFFLINALHILKNLWHVGSNCPVHLGLCYRVPIWTRSWIVISETSLSSIGRTSKQTFILQPFFYHICKSILRRTNVYCSTLILRRWLASLWILVWQSSSSPEGHGQIYGAVGGGGTCQEEPWVVRERSWHQGRRERNPTCASCQAHTG